MKLTFRGGDTPQLHRIEFRHDEKSRSLWLEQGKTRYFGWTAVPQALSLLFLDYIYHAAHKPLKDFEFVGTRRGSLAASLGNAIYQTKGLIYDLFIEALDGGAQVECISKIFDGYNLGGTEPKIRKVYIGSDFLPPDCIEVWRDGIAQTEPPQIKALKDEIRRSLKQPIETEEPAPAKTPESPPVTKPGPIPRTATELFSKDFGKQPTNPPPPKAEPKPPDEPLPSLEREQGKLSGMFAKVIGDALKQLQESIRRKPTAGKPPPAKETPKPTPKPRPSKGAAEEEADTKREKEPTAEPIRPEEPPLPPIDRRLFTVPDPGGMWPDEANLVELPGEDEETNYAWTLKNAFEGLLILGRTGSGKTTGSGFTFAEAFLRAGFGGLVLTVKKGEAEHWQRLCAACGRQQDLVVVRRGGDWKLNVLAYEAQRPGQGIGLAENLTSFCRNLLHISTRNSGTGNSDPVWQSAGDQLLNSTFDIFLLAGGGITFDRLAAFVSAAPTEKFPKSEADWLKIPVFGEVFAKAKKAVSSPEDERIFGKAKDYWFKVYPGYASKTRTSVTLGIFAMFDAFRGRDIPALISSDTNITPESIMSGKIVVLDLPLKELQHTGLMVQSTWKYLFQTALERQDNANSPSRRPVFLWEDEGQYFFSDHDHHFQDTARSARVCRVILTQNLPGFYKEFGRAGADITNSVFGNLNTKIFHNNSDLQTNEWASKHFGQEIHTRYTITNAPTPQPSDFFGMVKQSLDPSDTTSVSAGEHWEPAVRPEEFSVLRTGGPENDFMVDAYITWMGLSTGRQKHFTKITFAQNPNL